MTPNPDALASTGLDSSHTVLVVIPGAVVLELVCASLRSAGLFAVPASSAAEGLRLVGEVRPDAAVIDGDSPDAVAPALLNGLRADASRRPMPIVVLGADPAGVCGMQGERSGEALCVAKPFAPRELVRQIAALLRRHHGGRLRAGPLRLDMDRRSVTVTRGGRATEVALPPLEFRLLRCLMEQPNLTLSREAILESVWSGDRSVEIRTVDQCVKRTRRLLDAAGVGDMVKTVKGVGYHLDAVPPARSRTRADAPSPVGRRWEGAMTDL